MRLIAWMAAAACLSTLPGGAQTNPFFETWDAPFGVPPFERIHAEHFMPAFERGMAEARREVLAVADNPSAPTFANTIEALEASGMLLEKVGSVFRNLNNAETNEQLDAIARETAPMMAKLRDERLLNPKLFARVKAVWERRAGLKLTPEQLRLVEEIYKDFVRGGANLNAQDQQRLRGINEEFSLLGVKYGNNLLKETNSFKLTIDNQAQLAGLPAGVIKGAAAAAKTAGQPGKWVFTLQTPSIFPFLAGADDRDLRRQIYTAYLERANHGNATDNKQLLARIATLRAERAKLLGYPTHADYVLAENMAQNPARAYALLNQLWKPALAVAGKEAAALQEAIRADGKDFPLEAWDWRYYAEKVKKQRYDFEETQVRPYFAIDRVRDGVFEVAHRLYGITVTERTDIPKYHPEVRTFEVKDADGTHLGVFLSDYYPRPGKRSGGWTSSFRSTRFVNGKSVRPIVVNVCNFTRPSGNEPALLRPEEVRTLFHEFGHALHSLFSQVHYRSLGSTPRDFVELPSQIMENWAFQPEVLQFYAKHYKTGAPIPLELIAKMERAQKFNQGYNTVEYLAASFLDMDWHTIPAGAQPEAAAFEKASLEKIGLPPQIPVRYRSPYFQHIFAGGYSAGYYSYIWAEVLDADAFEAFREKGLFDQATARRFRKEVLERGDTAEAMDLYKNFRGREPSVEPLLVKRGLAGQ